MDLAKRLVLDVGLHISYSPSSVFVYSPRYTTFHNRLCGLLSFIGHTNRLGVEKSFWSDSELPSMSCAVARRTFEELDPDVGRLRRVDVYHAEVL